MRFSDTAGLLTYRQSRSRRRPACKDARLQGCTPAWMQVVERRREQAAEGVERRLPAAGRSGTSRQGVEPRLPAAGGSGTSGRGILPSFGNGPLKLRLFR